jgi:hypothetical protein
LATCPLLGGCFAVVSLTDADRADPWPPTSLRAPPLAVAAECVTSLRGCFAAWALAEALPPWLFLGRASSSVLAALRCCSFPLQVQSFRLGGGPLSNTFLSV